MPSYCTDCGTPLGTMKFCGNCGLAVAEMPKALVEDPTEMASTPSQGTLEEISPCALNYLAEVRGTDLPEHKGLRESVTALEQELASAGEERDGATIGESSGLPGWTTHLSGWLASFGGGSELSSTAVGLRESRFAELTIPARRACSAVAEAALRSEDVIPEWEMALRIDELKFCFYDLFLREGACLLSEAPYPFGRQGRIVRHVIRIWGNAMAGAATVRRIAFFPEDLASSQWYPRPSCDAVRDFAIGILFYEGGQLQLAFDQFRKAYKQAPEFVPARLLQIAAGAQLQSGIVTPKDLDDVITILPQDPRGLLIALSLASNGLAGPFSYEKTVSLAKKAVAASADDPVVLCHASTLLRFADEDRNDAHWREWLPGAEKLERTYFVPPLIATILDAGDSGSAPRPPKPSLFEAAAERTWLNPSDSVWPRSIQYPHPVSRQAVAQKAR